jgi:hypothetical protein
MNRWLRAFAHGALLTLTLTSGPVTAATGPPRPTPAPSPIVAARTIPDPAALYSAHARRLIAAYLRLRMLELREADLDRARAVIEGKIRIDDLLVPPARHPMVP